MKAFTALWLAAVAAWQCGVTPQWERHLADANSRARKTSESVPLDRRGYHGPLRITPYYGDLSGLDSTVVDHLKVKIVPEVVAWFRSALRVNQVKGNLVLGQDMCYQMQVPEEHRTVGVPQTDFILYIYTASGQGYAARGGTCVYDPSSIGNPIAGFYEINPSMYDSSLTDAKATVIARHEITHALVFSSINFGQFKQSDGSSYTDLIVTRSVRDIEQVSILRGPKATSLAKTGFGCDSLEGIQLEDMGGAGVAGSHWDKRVMFNDYMVGSFTLPPIYSKVTLGLFEDSGWYFPVYNYGEELIYGKGEGCGFVNQKCLQNEKAAFPEFCAMANDSMCDFTLTHKAKCNLKTYSTALGSPFSYFSDPTRGGEEAFLDYCPVAIGNDNDDCTAITTTVNAKDYGEYAGKDSRCFVGSLMSQISEPSATVQARCYKVTCGEESATVYVGDTVVSCPAAGGDVTGISGFTGSLTCPPFNSLCKAIPCSSGCHGVGQCLPAGYCLCNSGYYGPDCASLCSPGCSKCTGPGVQDCTQCDENADTTNDGCTCWLGFSLSEATRKCEPRAKDCDPGCASISGIAAVSLVKKHTLFSTTYALTPTPFICYQYPITACGAITEVPYVLNLPLPDDLSSLSLTENQCQRLLYYELLVVESWISEVFSTGICEPGHSAIVDLVFGAGIGEVATWSGFKAVVKGHRWGQVWTADDKAEVGKIAQEAWCVNNGKRCEEDLGAILGDCK